MADRAKAFFTETASMRTLTFPSADQADWGFRVGVTLLAVFAAAEIFGAGYYYVGRTRAARATAAPAAVATAPTPAQTPAVVPSAAPVAPLTTPAPAPVTAASPAAPTLSPADRLLQEARGLRERGDTTNAIARLQQANQSDPKNAAVLAEMASLYESIQLYDRSNETWRKIEDIGPSAGSYYDLAQNKLKLGASAPAVAAAAPAVTPATMPSPASAAPESAAGLTDIAEGAVMGIGEIQVTEAPDPEAETNLTVRIPIKARPGTIIDHTKVTIRVYFYDTIAEDPKPVLTDAQTQFEWLTPNHDWATPNPEVLAVNYYRAKNQAVSSEAALSAAAAAQVPGKKTKTTAPKTASGNRHYLGYIVRIYYNDKLQAQRAQPPQLLALFPSPASSQ